MNQYLLSTFEVEGQVPGAPSPEEMQQFMEKVVALEAELDEAGAFVFGGALRGPGDAAVVRPGDDGVVTSAGAFAESKEQVAGFYIINADDLDAARAWAEKVAVAVNHPIEVRAFRATGKAADHMPPA